MLAVLADLDLDPHICRIIEIIIAASDEQLKTIEAILSEDEITDT